MAERKSATAKSVSVVTAVVALVAIFGVEIEVEQVEAAKDAVGALVASAAVLYGFGRELYVKLKAVVGGEK